MNRRALLKALPAAAVAGATPAALCFADPTDTPVMRLFREWEAARKAYNDFDGDDCDEWPAMKRAEDRLLATPPQTVADYAAKLIVLNDFVGLEGVAWGDAMLTEARALIGGAV